MSQPSPNPAQLRLFRFLKDIPICKKQAEKPTRQKPKRHSLGYIIRGLFPKPKVETKKEEEPEKKAKGEKKKKAKPEDEEAEEVEGGQVVEVERGQVEEEKKAKKEEEEERKKKRKSWMPFKTADTRSPSIFMEP